jgi:hypothetical protein
MGDEDRQKQEPDHDFQSVGLLESPWSPETSFSESIRAN